VDNFENYLVTINGKPLRLKEKPAAGKYNITIKELSRKQIDTEYYIMTAIITIKYGSKVVWQRKVIGDGGC
jgi:hypothetical protein